MVSRAFFSLWSDSRSWRRHLRHIRRFSQDSGSLPPGDWSKMPRLVVKTCFRVSLGLRIKSALYIPGNYLVFKHFRGKILKNIIFFSEGVHMSVLHRYFVCNMSGLLGVYLTAKLGCLDFPKRVVRDSYVR